MADFISDLLGFGKATLCPPYDTLSSKRVSVGSKYSPDPAATKTSTLAGGLTTALTYIVATDIDKDNKVAIGMCTKDTSVAEYHSSQPDIFDIVSYDSSTGELMANVYNTSSSTGDKYSLGKGEKNGNAIHCAMFPYYMEDDEFAEYYEKLKEEAENDYPDRIKASEIMGVLNDNVYRRMKDSSIATHIRLPEFSGKTYSLPLIRNAAFATGTYDPTTVLVGNFEMLKGNSAGPVKSAGGASKSKYTREDLIDKFLLNPSRVFTTEEELLKQANRLDDYYIVDPMDLKICNIIQQTSNTNIPFRVFTFRGEAGSGKSEKCKAISNGVGLPLVRFTCSSNTEIFDFVGQVMPDTKKTDPSVSCDDALLAKLESMGGISFENIAKALGFPSLVDIHFDPVMAYEDMTGKTIDVSGEGDDEIYSVGGRTIGGKSEMMVEAARYWEETMKMKFDSIIATVRKNNGDDTKFIYTETPFIKAIKNGWVVEIQEPNVILSEGVLVGLNGLLAEGRITLPTGETIERHPDCVVIFTTNVTYNGCRAMNQSVIDRSNKVYDIDAPDVSVMAERAMSMSGNENEDDVTEMAQIVKDIASDMIAAGIDDGVCGMRSLANWALASRFEDPYDAFHECVLSKTSMDEESRLSLKKRIDESKFKPMKGKKRI